MKKTTENIIVLIIMVAIVVGLLCFVGYESIKDWFCTPFVWKEPDFLKIEYLGALEEKDHNKLIFSVYNSSDQNYDDYEFRVVTKQGAVEFNSLHGYETYGSEYGLRDYGIAANGFTTISVRCSEYNLLDDAYKLFENLSRSEIENLEIYVVRLGVHSKTAFSNNGWGKTIIVLAVSLVLGILGFVNRFPVWLRIVLKVCSLPIALVLGILYLLAKGKGSMENEQSAPSNTGNDSMYSSAKQRYDRAANLKAGAVISGNAHSAAKAQMEMDWAMADMISARGSGSSSAKEAAAQYRREASLKAGATITGNKANAARAQANMDKAMAKMIGKK